MKKKVAVVIPTKNESATIREVILSAKAEIERLGYELVRVFVTDDSRDDTRAIAKSVGATVVIGEGKGLGFAMWKGLKISLSVKPDIILSMDADGQSRMDEIGSFLAPVANGEADLVLGSRFQQKGLIDYKYRFKNRFGIFILVRILRYLTKLPLTDSHGGLRAMSSEVVNELEMIGTHTYVQETIIDAREKGFRIKEIPSAWDVRKSGKSRVVSSIPLYVFYTLPVLILRSGHHIRFLYPWGIFFIFLSILDFVIVAWQTNLSLHAMFERKSFILILSFLSIGLNFLFFGFQLELTDRIKRRVDRLYL
ncbi:MAG: glycosyltransferase family 2 protein [Oligoflexia bacterium]|nr:glycosyltransferase family 2 protein [Oligoflexia bacterium]